MTPMSWRKRAMARLFRRETVTYRVRRLDLTDEYIVSCRMNRGVWVRHFSATEIEGARGGPADAAKTAIRERGTGGSWEQYVEEIAPWA